jgi:hypothetical protein
MAPARQRRIYLILKEMNWLGVRDDFRNWFVQGAA